MTFAYPAVLLSLWLSPLPGLLIILARRRQKQRTARLVNPNAIRGNIASRSDVVFHAQLTMIFLAFVLILVAAAGPRWGLRDEVVFGSGRNVLIVLDVSRSMLANDVHPNRLERAKADLSDLLAELQGDRAGILVFRNGAVLLCPFTTDMAFLLQTLSGITIDSAPRGETDIGSAISTALESFKDLGSDHNAIILISDGEDLSGKALAKAAEAGERGIPVFCVGIGDTQGSTIPTDAAGLMKYKGENVVSKLDNKTLLDIATASKGAYIPLMTSATGRTTLGEVYARHVRTIAAQEMQERLETRLIERFQIFLIPGVVLLVAAASLSYGRPGKSRKLAKKVAAAMLALMLPLLSPASTNEIVSAPMQADAIPASEYAGKTAHEIARKAQRAWAHGDFANAAELYQVALSREQPDPELTQTLRFNAAISFLKAGNAGKAAEMFRLIAAKSESGTEAAEGLGVALFRAAEALSALETEEPQTADPANPQNAPQKPKRNIAAEKLKLFEEASAAFQQALRGLPEDDLRRKNLLAAIADIPKLREDARINSIQAKYGEMTPEQLVPKLLELQRDAYAASVSAFAHDSPDRIRMLEKTAQRQREAADLWMPLHQKMTEADKNSITNADALANFTFQLDTAKDQAEGAADALEDLDVSSMDAMRDSERLALQLLARATPPPVILAESIQSQSNALAHAVNPSKIRKPLEDQTTSAGLFKRFSEGYGKWLDQQARQQPPMPAQTSVTNQPAMTPEIRKEIDDLVSKTLGSHALVQMDVGTGDSLLSDKARINAGQALKDMTRIMELLPKPPQQQQDQQKQDQQKQDQQKQDQQSQSDNAKSDSQRKPDEKPQDKQDQEKNQKDEEQKQEDPQQADEKEQESEARKTEETAEEKDAKEVMARIIEQEKKREEDRLRRQRTMPPRVGERDW